MVFQTILDGWESWGKVYSSAQAFAPLASAIFEKEKILIKEPIKILTLGTNAVFKADSYVIKIYAPIEVNKDADTDYKTELTVMRFAMDKLIEIPKIIGHGELKDRYLFRYLIMEFIPSAFFINEIRHSSLSKKRAFVKKIKQIQLKLNQPIGHLLPPIDPRIQEKRTERMQGLNATLISELSNYAENLDFSSAVLVHGDITRENILISANGSVTLIDFADCIVAPYYYELPPLIFELFLCDKELVSEYIGSDDKDLFLDTLIKGFSIHLFSGFILKDYFDRINLPKDSVKSMEELRQLFSKQLF